MNDQIRSLRQVSNSYYFCATCLTIIFFTVSSQIVHYATYIDFGVLILQLHNNIAKSGGKVCPKDACQSTAVFSIGTGITIANSDITDSKLPTNNQVLQCYKCNQLPLNGARHEKQNAKTVTKKIIPVYQKANITIITEKKHGRKLLHSFKKCQTPKKTYSKPEFISTCTQ